MSDARRFTVMWNRQDTNRPGYVIMDSRQRFLSHDLALSRIGPGGREVQTTYWVDDVKYNSSPDICRVGGALYVLYGKFDHLYGMPDDPAVDHGTSWGKTTR